MVSENTLVLYQQGLQLGSYFVKWGLAIDQGLPRLIILQNNYSGPNSKGGLNLSRIYGAYLLTNPNGRGLFLYKSLLL